MHLCGICIENVESPAALPCGHIFCSGCIFRAVDAIKPYSTLHCCPTCRSRYNLTSVDPGLAPPYPRNHLLPSIRKLYLDQRAPLPAPISTVATIARENRRLLAENSALRTNCEMWRKRAEAHGAATLNLLGLLRVAKDQVSQVQRGQRCNDPERKLDEDEPSQSLADLPPSGAHDTPTVDYLRERSVPVPLVQPYLGSLTPSSHQKGFVTAESTRPLKRTRR